MPKFIPDNTGRIRVDMRGKNHWFWKGDNVGYDALHDWVNRYLGKANKCSNNPSHKSPVYYWANISGEYKRELSDWRELCPKCNKNDGIKIPERLKGGYSLGNL